MFVVVVWVVLGVIRICWHCWYYLLGLLALSELLLENLPHDQAIVNNRAKSFASAPKAAAFLYLCIMFLCVFLFIFSARARVRCNRALSLLCT